MLYLPFTCICVATRMPPRFRAESNLHPVDTVDRWIAGRRPAQRGHESIRDETHVHQMILHRFGQVQSDQNPALADVQLTKHAHLPDSAGLPERQHP